MGGLDLTERDRALMDGEGTAAEQLAMQLVTAVAEAMGAERLLDVTGAHIDSCLFHGRAGLDFAERLVAGDARVAVPTTLNVSSLDLLHPDLYRGDPGTGRLARRLMECYEEMGCRPTWTCAPYQLPERPGFGEHVAWAESNATVFANSVLGARTHRYGDFIDVCAAITGRAPAGGLHLDGPRLGQMLFRVSGVAPRLLEADVLYPVLGHLIGYRAGMRVPVIDGLPAHIEEDALKALGAAAASSGSVALFHVVGVTPEAPSLEAAFGGREPKEIVDVGPGELRAARDDLSTAKNGRLSAVSLGTPHASLAEFARLIPLVEGGRVHPDIEFYVSTGRDVLAEVERRGWLEALVQAGVQVVVDTCTYITPILRNRTGVVMTDSAKWAYYAPGNLGVHVAFGGMEECVRSALTGEIVRNEELWDGL